LLLLGVNEYLVMRLSRRYSIVTVLPGKSYFILFLYFLIMTACSQQRREADLIVINSEIWTGDPKHQDFKGENTKVVDAAGGFIVPGFIDSHVHLMMGGNALLSVALGDARTKEEFIRRIATYAQTLKPGEWILEGNWDHTLWGGDLPQKEWIDEFTKENPVVIYRLDGHMVLANSKALSLAGITNEIINLTAGEIVRNQDGSPTGILKGSAMNLMLQSIPEMSTTQKKNALLAANDYLLSKGVTSVHDVDSLGTYSVAKELYTKKELDIRIYAAKPLNRHKEVQPKDDKWLKTGLVKGFVDGSLGSHTAAFKDAYVDQQEDYGFFITKEADLFKWVSSADADNKQIAVHAIGDRANEMLLKTYAKVIQKNGEKDRRFRVEHAQHLLKSNFSDFASLGIIASMQPYHAIDDGRWAEELIGEERIRTAFGSDWPVAPASPLMGIYAATTRRTLDDKNPNGWVPEQKITAEQALIAYTKNAAFASFEEQRKGTLEVGKLADFVILSDDITKIKPAAIKDVVVWQTFVGGKKRFDIENQNK